MVDIDDDRNLPSYQKINYSLRPAKSAERKMLCEAIRKLSFFNKIENYRYIGFGSTYFSDFSLFHRSLGITDMISIEKNDEDESRFKFNIPYKCIELIFGLSNEILPTLDWTKPTILWLDYDRKLDKDKLQDIGLFCAKAVPGSMIIISVNALPDGHETKSKNRKKIQDLLKYRFNMLKERVGSERIPADIEGKDLSKKGVSAVLRRIMINEILEVLSMRNGGLVEDQHINFRQVFNFTYEDGARMLTIGGILYSAPQINILDQCDFENLAFTSSDEKEFNIGIPKLTFREIRYLDKRLPRRNEAGEQITIPMEDLGELSSIPIEDIEGYMKIYRYFPNFAETDI